MGFFDKKYCDICGEKIGLLGNRKLEDGNLCKDCAKKLSPFFSERRHSTIDEIKQQLAYREENERRLADFHPDASFGEWKKVYIDRAGAKFIVTSASKWRSANPDLIAFSQVRGVNTDIHENKTEIYRKDSEGNRKSYNPRRYEYDYEFNVKIMVDSPWFDEIELELSQGNRPDSPYTDLYRRYERQMHELSDMLSGAHGVTEQKAPAADSAPKTREQEIIEDVIKKSTWVCKTCGLANPGTLSCRQCGGPVSDEQVLSSARTIAQATLMMEGTAAKGSAASERQSAPQGWSCPFCGTQNSGKFCENCGAAKPEEKVGACPSCGYVLPGDAPTPKFCPECGTPLSGRQ